MNKDGQRHGNLFISLRSSDKLCCHTSLCAECKEIEIATEKLSQKIQSGRQKMFRIPANTFN